MGSFVVCADNRVARCTPANQADHFIPYHGGHPGGNYDAKKRASHSTFLFSRTGTVACDPGHPGSRTRAATLGRWHFQCSCHETRFSAAEAGSHSAAERIVQRSEE